MVTSIDSSIWPIDRTLIGSNTLGQYGFERNSNDGVLHIFQSFKTEAWDTLVKIYFLDVLKLEDFDNFNKTNHLKFLHYKYQIQCLIWVS